MTCRIINYLKFSLLTLCLSIFFNFTSQSYEVKIIKKIGREIVTNIDIKKEYQYLIALSKGFKDANEEEVFDIATQSVIKEKIKKNEILKFFVLGNKNEDLIKNVIKNIYLRLDLVNEEQFKDHLRDYNLTYKEIYDKIEIEIVWNQLIYSKYFQQVNINKEKIREELQNTKEDRLSYNLSEIMLLGQTKSEILRKYEDIKIYINELGFERAALLYSQSGTKSMNGLLGWVFEDQLSDAFKKELKNLETGQISKALNISGGILLIKINDSKIETKEINLEEEIGKNIKFETEKQLNNFSLIYFNKIKNNLINE